MQKTISLKLLPEEAANPNILLQYLATAASVSPSRITGHRILKRSLDARSRQAWILLSILLFIDEAFQPASFQLPLLRSVTNSQKQVIIVGAGPAGLFAALKLLEAGIRPIILERGKDVRARRRDLALLNKEGIINPESNYCFGEGGAGTYSDGKLYTRSAKRGNIARILEILVRFGADERIRYEAHPHIGTNKLPGIISAMRQAILEAGGEYLFNTRVSGLLIEQGQLRGVETAGGSNYYADAVVLATGHSARDIFELLHRHQIRIAAKPFALGVRIEHPQALIDQIQYHCPVRNAFLPPASYSLVEQVNGRGVFSFCMCPGGIIAPAATAAGEIVVNGWSPSKRNNPYANSGLVVSIEEEDFAGLQQTAGPLAALAFQRAVEQKAFAAGGGNLVAPAQRMVDFVNNKVSANLPACSYHPGLNSVALSEVLPGFVYQSLAQAFKGFGKKLKGYLTNEAVVVATESRTSSPVRIPRHPELLQHPEMPGLYPCGEGAGYAGGIVSAAMDGERVAAAIASRW